MGLVRRAAGLLIVALAVAFLATLGGERVQYTSGPPVSAETAELVLPPGYQGELVARGLSFPTQVTFDERGELYVVESGSHGEGVARLVKLMPGGALRPVATGFTPPLIGVALKDGRIWASHRGRITLIEPNGGRRDLVTGLPSLGDHTNNFPVFSPDGWLYFGEGTATNSAVVGLDNLRWLRSRPGVHDRPATDIELVGHNFRTANPLVPGEPSLAVTGAYSPFGVSTVPGQTIRGSVKPNGALYRMRPDGTGLEVVAWGFRNPYGLAFDRKGLLWVYNHGYDERGSRPVANALDEVYAVRGGEWYGWPDFSAGEPLTQPKFKPASGEQPQFLLQKHPSTPPRPLAVLPPHSAGGQFDFAPPRFGYVDEFFIPLIGPFTPRTPAERATGAKLVRLTRSGKLFDFAVNRVPGPAAQSGTTGFNHPSCAKFGPDGALYVTDLGEIRSGAKGLEFLPNTGALWRISRQASRPAVAPALGEAGEKGFGALGPVGTFVLGILFGGLLAAAVSSTIRGRRS